MGEEDVELEWKKQVISLGQHGGFRGDAWDDGVFPWIKQVEISYDDEHIIFIRTQYSDDDGNPTWSDKHGGNDDKGTVKTVALDYPNEYLISIHGYMGKDGGNGFYLIRSLTLESNQKTFGPFGVERGTRFWFPTTGAKVVSFHGRGAWFLESIGIKVVPYHKTLQ